MAGVGDQIPRPDYLGPGLARPKFQKGWSSGSLGWGDSWLGPRHRGTGLAWGLSGCPLSGKPPHIARWLSPFFLACAIYFLIWVPEDRPSWVSALVKGLPILCLVVFLGVVAPDGGSTPLFQGGLLCSFVGDACLVWPEAFLYGMAAFAAAHLLYLAALGFSPLRPGLLLPVLLSSGAFLGLLRPHLPPALAAPVAAYALLLALVLWRGLARGAGAGRGALLFAFSDALLAWDTFVQRLPHGRLLVMASYYAGQAFLARSAVGSPRHRAG